MGYFNIESFITKLTAMAEGKYRITKRSKEGEPLRYKLTGTPQDFVFVTLADNNDQVSVLLDFGTYTSVDFINEVSKQITRISREE